MAWNSLVFSCFIKIGIFIAVQGLRRNQFGTKTSYDELVTPTASRNEYWWVNILQGYKCEAIHVAGVYRHGNRNPGADVIKSIDTLAGTLKNTSSIFDLTDWQNPVQEKDEYLLTVEGEKQMVDLGNKLATRVSSAFDRVKILVTSSETSRVKKSARKFLQGMLPELASVFEVLDASVLTNNTLIRFYDSCEKHTKSVVRNATALKEITKFDESEIMKELIERIKTKLGLSSEYPLNLAQVDAVYQYCALELELFNKSVWCEALTDEDLGIMEYRKDLEIYWKETYGYAINYEMVCPLWSDIFDGMKSAVENENALKEKTANFLFGPSQTLNGLMAALGLYKDTEPLMADGMEKQKNRKMKSSEAVPFSANLVFVVYRCNGTVEVTSDQQIYRSDHIIRMFHNEKEINFPGVTEDYCPYDFLGSRYGNETKCEFEKICKYVPASAAPTCLSFVVLLGTFIIQLFL